MPAPQNRNKYLPAALDLTPSISRSSTILSLMQDGPIPIINYGTGALRTVRYFQLYARMLPTRNQAINPYESGNHIPQIDWQGLSIPHDLVTYSIGNKWDKRMNETDDFYTANMKALKAAETRLDVYTNFDLDFADFCANLTNWRAGAAFQLLTPAANAWDHVTTPPNNDIDPFTDTVSGMKRVFYIMRNRNALVTDIMMDSLAYLALSSNSIVAQKCAGGNAGSAPTPSQSQIESQLQLLNFNRPVKIHIIELGVQNTAMVPGALSGTYTRIYNNGVMYLSNGITSKTLSDVPPPIDGSTADLPQLACPFIGVFGNEILDPRDRGDTWVEGEDMSVNGAIVPISTDLSYIQGNVAGTAII